MKGWALIEYGGDWEDSWEKIVKIYLSKEKAEEIKYHISRNLGRGVTAFKSDKGFGSRGEFGEEGKVLFCVVTRLEVSKLLLEIEKIDATAFVVQHAIKDTKGGMIKKRPLH